MKCYLPKNFHSKSNTEAPTSLSSSSSSSWSNKYFINFLSLLPFFFSPRQKVFHHKFRKRLKVNMITSRKQKAHIRHHTRLLVVSPTTQKGIKCFTFKMKNWNISFLKHGIILIILSQSTRDELVLYRLLFSPFDIHHVCGCCMQTIHMRILLWFFSFSFSFTRLSIDNDSFCFRFEISIEYDVRKEFSFQ